MWFENSHTEDSGPSRRDLPRVHYTSVGTGNTYTTETGVSSTLRVKVGLSPDPVVICWTSTDPEGLSGLVQDTVLVTVGVYSEGVEQDHSVFVVPPSDQVRSLTLSPVQRGCRLSGEETHQT